MSCTYINRFGCNKDQVCNKEHCQKHNVAPKYYVELLEFLEMECNISYVRNPTSIYLNNYDQLEKYFNNIIPLKDLKFNHKLYQR